MTFPDQEAKSKGELGKDWLVHYSARLSTGNQQRNMTFLILKELKV